MLDWNTESIGAAPLFERLSDDVKACLLSSARVRRFSRGETICLQGEHAMCLKVVQSGWVKLYRVSTNGDEAVLATLHDGQSFDEIAALQAGTSPASAEAVSECSVIMLDLTLIHRCEHAYREINQAVLSAASAQLDDMLGHIEQLKVQTGTQRLSEFLIDLSDASSGSSELALPYEKTVLAAKLGMKPESLSRAFRRLKQIGVQSKLRQVRISDVSVLKAFAMESAEFS